MRRLHAGLSVVVVIGLQPIARGDPVYVYQGPEWTIAARADFYIRDQGSKMIPLSWMKALKQANGQPFLADALTRYGYLENPESPEKLPIGFTAAGPKGSKVVGMTCSACHTREVTAEGKTYRIDGGPAIVDFQTFLMDVDKAVGSVLASNTAFDTFASEVLGSPTPTRADASSLRKAVEMWHLRYHTLVQAALPTQKWGPGRADAVGMIFNRLTGLDLGKPPSYLIPENIRKADAPTRYPFIWNSSRQDWTQWPGLAKNGNDTLALGRNVGQVIGVFATFAPRNKGSFIDYLADNSTNFDGLTHLEDLVKKIGPPKWPWGVDTVLAAEGKTVFERQGDCVRCHEAKTGAFRSIFATTWKTVIVPVRTDTRQYEILQWTAKTGSLEGAYFPLVSQPLKETALAKDILGTAVTGAVAEWVLLGNGVPLTDEIRTLRSPVANAGRAALQDADSDIQLPIDLRQLGGMFRDVPPSPLVGQAALAAAGDEPPYGSYEARVLQGIWATAPYLHNGSVPTLADLLKPASQRPKSFRIGPAYDTKNVGLAVVQTKFDQVLDTTDCDDSASGNSRCGHEYGITLSDDDKKALLEYLKIL